MREKCLTLRIVCNISGFSSCYVGQPQTFHWRKARQVLYFSWKIFLIFSCLSLVYALRYSAYNWVLRFLWFWGYYMLMMLLNIALWKTAAIIAFTSLLFVYWLLQLTMIGCDNSSGRSGYRNDRNDGFRGRGNFGGGRGGGGSFNGRNDFEKRGDFSGRPRGGNNNGRINGDAVPRSYQNGGGKAPRQQAPVKVQ